VAKTDDSWLYIEPRPHTRKITKKKSDQRQVFNFVAGKLTS